MKTLIAFASLFVSLVGHSQTFINYKITNFTAIGGGVVSATTNIVLSSNTVARLLNVQFSGVTNMTFGVQYPGGPLMTFPIQNAINIPVLGTATLSATATAPQGSSPIGYLLVQFDVVNTALPTQDAMVIPQGHSAIMTMQTSTNLTTWTAATNGNYGVSNVNRFFRMRLQLQ